MSTYFTQAVRQPLKSMLKSKWHISSSFQFQNVKRSGASIGTGLYIHTMIPAPFTFMDASISVQLLKTSAACPIQENSSDVFPSLNLSEEETASPLPFTRTKPGMPFSKLYCELIAAFSIMEPTHAKTIQKKNRFIWLLIIMYFANISLFFQRDKGSQDKKSSISSLF